MAPCDWDIESCGCGGGCLQQAPPAVRTYAVAAASHIMWALTGRRYGRCEITVQPCNPSPLMPEYQTWPVGADGPYSGPLGTPVLDGGRWYNRRGGSCCTARCEVPLAGPTDTDQVVSVTVAGELVDPAAYQIHDRHLLVRIDGGCWPTCRDYGQQDPPAFEVIYRRGDAVPAPVLGAAAVLACEIGRSCTGGDCRLPGTVSRMTRQGVDVSMVDVTDYLDRGLTGIPEVDRVIAVDNPHRRHSRPQVMSPDMHPPRMVT